MSLLMELSMIARAWWGLWLMIVFIGIVGWAMWPSRRRSEEMQDAAMIPFRNDDESVANTETR